MSTEIKIRKNWIFLGKKHLGSRFSASLIRSHFPVASSYGSRPLSPLLILVISFTETGKKCISFHHQSPLSMNNMIDSSSLLETLSLNYASFGGFTVVNNLWTWVAVITAAISFWRIRTNSFSYQQTPIDPNPSGSHAQPSANTCVEPRAPIPALPSLSDCKDVDGLTEGSKYTMYYYVEEEERERDGGDVDAEEWRDDGGGDNGVSCGEQWERVMMRERIGNVGWYSYQDLTVVNGNVVRLWDECKRISEKNCICCSSCCAVWSLLN